MVLRPSCYYGVEWDSEGNVDWMDLEMEGDGFADQCDPACDWKIIGLICCIWWHECF